MGCAPATTGKLASCPLVQLAERRTLAAKIQVRVLRGQLMVIPCPLAEFLVVYLDLDKSPVCAKCGSSQSLQRHHKGCEKMWLRHFKHKSRTKKFQEHESRYWEFRPEDVVKLCDECHLKIHRIYLRIINRWCSKHGKLSTWSWHLANGLMKALRNRCDVWLRNQYVRPSKLHRVKPR